MAIMVDKGQMKYCSYFDGHTKCFKVPA